MLNAALVPRDAFPETLHSSHGKTMHVTFPLPKDPDEEHHLVWRADNGGSGSRYDDIIPEYQFVSAEARRVFQGDVRGKDLVDGATFDTDVIWTDRTESRYDRRESYGQDLKLWCGVRGQGQGACHTLSFNVTNGAYKNRHVECGLQRFSTTARTGCKDLHVVYLDLIDCHDRTSQSTAATDELPISPTGTEPPQKKKKKKRVFSGIFSRPQGTERATKRASFTSQKSVQTLLGDDFFADLRYLAIEFSHVEDRKGRVVETASKGKCLLSAP